MAAALPIVAFATEKDLEKHLTICENSEYFIRRDPDCGMVVVQDESHVVLSGLKVLGIWVLSLNRRYYRHPFDVRSSEKT